MKVASLAIAAVSALAIQVGAKLSSVSRLGQTSSAAEFDAEERRLREESMPMGTTAGGSFSSGFSGSKYGKSSKDGTCKRRTKPKRTKECRKENPYNGLQDIVKVEPDLTLDQAVIGRCIAAYLSSGYDLTDFENYANWIDDDTTMMVADTGFWQGADGIMEYAKLVFIPGPCASAPFVTAFNIVDNTAGVLPIAAEGDECTLLFSTKVKIQNSCVFNGDLDSIVGNRLSFTILDDVPSPQASIRMNRIDVYFPPGNLAYLFSAEKITDYATSMCSTMQSFCSETFENNCYNAPGAISGIDKCVQDLMSLPATDNDGPSVDGKTFSCRILHSLLAASNEKHCPHISFDPEYDSNCFAKCQQAAYITNADMFHPIELGFMAGEAATHGLPAAQWEYNDEE